MRNRSSSSTHKKVMVLLFDHTVLRGYLNPSSLGQAETLDLLTPEGEHQAIATGEVKSVHFVREFVEKFEAERKAFFSRPKLDGLWVRLSFRDGDSIEGIVPNDLLDMLDHGVQITPPDMHGNSLRMFIPRAALGGIKVLGVVGVARRAPKTAATLPPQPKLFSE